MIPTHAHTPRRRRCCGWSLGWYTVAVNHFRRRFLPFVLCLLAGLLVAGCAPARTTAQGAGAVVSGFPLTVEDDAGRAVTLTAPPRRILSLSPAHTETLFALGAGDRVVAVDNYADFPAEVEGLPRVNCWPSPSAEQIAALDPDLVLVLTEGPDFLTRMDALDIPALKIFPRDLEQTLARIELLGRIVERSDAAGDLTEEMRRRIEEVRARVAAAPAPRVLFELDASDPARPYAAGGTGFYSHLLEVAGGANIFRDLRVEAAQVSGEEILLRDPEVILLGNSNSPIQPQQPDQVKRRPGWNILSAVKAGRIHTVNSDRITRPGPRLVEGLEEIADLLHP
jgi:iron complex transport system substrate-binding protein